jgi:hypothetical protein
MAVMVNEPKESWCFYKESDNGKKHLVLKNWSKRYDHRHHAIDALVVACTEQKHITQINTLNQIVQSKLKEQFNLVQETGREYTEEELVERLASLSKEEKEKFQQSIGKLRDFEIPWKNFHVEAKEKIEQTIVSFKGKKRILIQNKEDKKTGKRINDKLMLKVRGALHKETIYGKFIDEEKKTVNIKTAFELTEYIIDPEIKMLIEQRIEEYNGDIDEAVQSLKSKSGKLKNYKGEEIKKVDLYFKEKDCYRIDLIKFSDKKHAEGIIDRVIDKLGFLKRDLFDHFYRYSLETKIEQAKNDGESLPESILNSIKELLNHEYINEEEIEKFFNNFPNTERKKIRNWINAKVAFSQDGIDAFNEKRINRKLKPVENVKVLYSTSAGESSLQPIKRVHREDGKGEYDYVKPGDNYCYAILQKNNERGFKPITFFDAARWVTLRFRQDLKTGFQFPKNYNERLKYVENTIREKIMSDNPGWEILYLLQQDDLVYHPIDEEDAKLALQNRGDDFWYDMEKKRWKRIYRVVKFSGSRSHYVNHNIAAPINYKPILDYDEIRIREQNNQEIPKEGLFEFSDKNCSQFEVTEEYILEALKKKNKKYKAKKIQDTCIKIEVDRLGRIIAST